MEDGTELISVYRCVFSAHRTLYTNDQSLVNDFQFNLLEYNARCVLCAC
jgi:hypothetical protein